MRITPPTAKKSDVAAINTMKRGSKITAENSMGNLKRRATNMKNNMINNKVISKDPVMLFVTSVKIPAIKPV